MNRGFIPFFCLALLVPSAAEAQSLSEIFEKVIGVPNSAPSAPKTSRAVTNGTNKDGTRRYDVGGFEVAGVRLGMSPSEVRSALVEKGFTVADRGSVATFQSAVDARARQMNRQAPTFPEIAGPGSIVGSDNDRNTITVEFFSTRDAVIVSGIYLTFDGATVASSQIWNDVISKYGTPSADNYPVAYHWCDQKDPNACGPGVSADAPKLSFNQSVRSFTLELSNYMMLKNRQAAELAALFPAPDGKRQRGLLGGS